MLRSKENCHISTYLMNQLNTPMLAEVNFCFYVGIYLYKWCFRPNLLNQNLHFLQRRVILKFLVGKARASQSRTNHHIRHDINYTYCLLSLHGAERHTWIHKSPLLHILHRWETHFHFKKRLPIKQHIMQAKRRGNLYDINIQIDQIEYSQVTECFKSFKNGLNANTLQGEELW